MQQLLIRTDTCANMKGFGMLVYARLSQADRLAAVEGRGAADLQRNASDLSDVTSLLTWTCLVGRSNPQWRS